MTMGPEFGTTHQPTDIIPQVTQVTLVGGTLTQRVEQQTTPDQGPSIAPEAGRGSERIWLFLGTLVTSAAVGGAIGYLLKPVLGASGEIGLSYYLLASGVGMLVGLSGLGYLVRSGRVKL